jgi:TonB family protein
MKMRVRWLAVGFCLCSVGLAWPQTLPTQQSIEAKLQAPFLMLRGMWDCNSLHFDANGNLIGSCDTGPFSLSAMTVKSVKLGDRKVEIKGSRAGLQFAPAAWPGGPEQVRPVHLDNMTVSIERDPQNPEELDAALDRIFARGFDDALAEESPVYWRGWIRHQLHPEIPIISLSQGVVRFGGGSGAVPGVVAPRIVRTLDPNISEEARRTKTSGTILLGLMVDAEGRPQNVSIVRPLGMGLDEQAVRTVSQYRFAPATRDRKPIPAMIHIEINFRIY